MQMKYVRRKTLQDVLLRKNNQLFSFNSTSWGVSLHRNDHDLLFNSYYNQPSDQSELRIRTDQSELRTSRIYFCTHTYCMCVNYNFIHICFFDTTMISLRNNPKDHLNICCISSQWTARTLTSHTPALMAQFTKPAFALEHLQDSSFLHSITRRDGAEGSICLPDPRTGSAPRHRSVLSALIKEELTYAKPSKLNAQALITVEWNTLSLRSSGDSTYR